MTRRRRVNYTGRPTPREKRRLPSDRATIAFLLIVIAVLSFLIARGLAQGQTGKMQAGQEHKITHDSLCATYTYDGEVVRWYVFVDPEYGTQWVYNDHDWRAFPRIDANGTQIGLQSKSDYE